MRTPVPLEISAEEPLAVLPQWKVQFLKVATAADAISTVPKALVAPCDPEVPRRVLPVKTATAVPVIETQGVVAVLEQATSPPMRLNVPELNVITFDVPPEIVGVVRLTVVPEAPEDTVLIAPPELAPPTTPAEAVTLSVRLPEVALPYRQVPSVPPPPVTIPVAVQSSVPVKAVGASMNDVTEVLFVIAVTATELIVTMPLPARVMIPPVPVAR